MRTWTFIICIFLTPNIFGQATDSLGISDNLILNRQETDFLNSALKNSRDTFDFENKKIAFVTGSNGGKLIPKQKYFLTCVKPWTEIESLPQIFFVRLTPDEKQKSGGYDTFVLSLVKLFTNKQGKKISEQLSRNK